MHNLFFFIIFIIKTISYIVQAGLELTAFQLCLIIAGITGVCRHTQLYTVSLIYLRFGFYFKLCMCGFVHVSAAPSEARRGHCVSWCWGCW